MVTREDGGGSGEGALGAEAEAVEEVLMGERAHLR